MPITESQSKPQRRFAPKDLIGFLQKTDRHQIGMVIGIVGIATFFLPFCLLPRGRLCLTATTAYCTANVTTFELAPPTPTTNGMASPPDKEAGISAFT